MKQQKKNWPAESNMTALKTLSHTLLHLDIQPTKMSPLVVKHPFTDSGLAGIYAEDGSLSVGNLLDSPDALRTWRENFSRRINEAETAMNLFCMITKPYQFGYLRLAAAHLSEQDKMEFVGGHPDEYCIFLKNLTETELAQITSLDGAPLDVKEERSDIE